MITKDDFIKRCTSGKPTEYDVDKHLGIMIDIFSEGEGVVAFCAETLIAKTTFYEWLESHKEFKFAYDIMINVSCAWWERYPKNNPNFNFPYWATIMHERFGYEIPSYGDDDVQDDEIDDDTRDDYGVAYDVDDYAELLQKIKLCGSVLKVEA